MELEGWIGRVVELWRGALVGLGEISGGMLQEMVGLGAALALVLALALRDAAVGWWAPDTSFAADRVMEAGAVGRGDRGEAAVGWRLPVPGLEAEAPRVHTS